MEPLEAEKASIIAEIEESVGIGKERYLKFGSYYDTSFGSKIMNYSRNFGIDYLYRPSTQGDAPQTARIVLDYDKEENCIQYFLQFIDHFDDIDWYEYEEDESNSLSYRDKLTAMKLEASPFEDFREALKRDGFTLGQCLDTVRLVKSFSRGSKRKLSRKDRKRERRDKESKEPDTNAGITKFRKDRIVVETALPIEQKLAIERITIAVAKAIVDDDLAGYLSVASLLLQFIQGIPYSSIGSYLLPLGNMIALMFEKPELNPFGMYSIKTKSTRSKSFTGSEISKHEIPHFDDHRDPTAGHFHGTSDAGSTIGSTHAEIGTDTTSIMGDEMNEEDILAQALALSVGEDIHKSDTSSVEEHASSSSDFHMDISLDASNLQLSAIVNGDVDVREPFSATAPFKCKEFVSAIYGGNAASRVASNLVPIREVFVSLMVALNISLESKLHSSDAPKSIFPTESARGGLSNRMQIVISSSSESICCLEFLINTLKSMIVSHCSEEINTGAQNVNIAERTMEWHLHMYILTWSLHSLLRLSSELTSKASMKILRSQFSSASNSALQEKRSIMRLREVLVELMGISNSVIKPSAVGFDITKYPDSFPVNLQLADVSSSMFGSSNDPAVVILDYRFCHRNILHNLRLSSIDAFLSLFHVVSSDPVSRQEALFNLISTTATDSEHIVFQCLQKILLSDLQHALGNGEVIYMKEYNFACREDLYHNYFLQRLCVEILKADEQLLPYFCFLTTVDNSAFENAFDFDFDERYASSLQKLMNIILSRLNKRALTSNFYGAKEDNLIGGRLWGELDFIRCAQSLVFDKIDRDLGSYWNNKGLIYQEFRDAKSHPSLVFSDDMKVVTHVGAKAWCSVLTSTGFEPNSGVYEWTIKIDHCSKGHVFVGVATSEMVCDKDGYVGVDKYGWGLIGSRSLWHARGKVRSDYGNGFGSGSLISAVYNSDNHTLSFRCDGIDWGVAFDNIPKVKVFPAFSLHEKNDQISILRCICRDDGPLLTKSRGTSLDLRADTWPGFFADYCQTVLMMSDKTVANSHRTGEERILLSPIVTILSASLLAYTQSPKFSYLADSPIIVSILPYLTVYSRRLANLSDKLSGRKGGISMQSGGQTHFHAHCIYGDWQIRSSLSPLCVPHVWQLSPLAKEFNDLESDEVDSTQFLSYVSGKVSFPEGSVADIIVGIQEKSKFKLSMCDRTGNLVVTDGRLSLCGRYFYATRLESGRLSRLEGLMVNFDENFVGNMEIHTIKQLAYLAFSSCSLLAGKLVGDSISSDRFRDLEIKDTTASEDALFSISESVAKEAEEAFEEGSPQVKNWTDSVLFSGGLALNSRNMEAVMKFLSAYLSKYCPSVRDLIMKRSMEGDNHDESHTMEDYLASWLDIVLLLKSDVGEEWNESKNLSDVLDVGSDESHFYSALLDGKSTAASLDEYISLFVGQSAVLKIGGAIMTRTRRMVIVSLIQHSGCFRVCEAEMLAILNGEKSLSDKPVTVLLEIWRAAIRVIENVIRIKQETGDSYENICRSVCRKAEFLGQIDQSKACSSINSNFMFMEKGQILNDRWYLEAGLRVHSVIAKLIAETTEFFTNTNSNVDAFYGKLIERTVDAFLRIAGFKSYLYLLGKVDREWQKLSFFAAGPGLHHEYHTMALKHLPVFRQNAVVMNAQQHYGSGLRGVCQKVKTSLQYSFEQLYELITQHLTKSTWAKDREGQFAALKAWNILIQPDDHLFLNRMNLFRTLHTVLDDVRGCIDNRNTNEDDEMDIFETFYENAHRDQLSFIVSVKKEFSLVRHMTLAQLVLNTVHSLASQIAASSENVADDFDLGAAHLLRRTSSGPDTLSRSLFDLMFSEYLSSIKPMIMDNLENNMLATATDMFDAKSPTVITEKSSNAMKLIEGEDYLYRILNLLKMVAQSKNCLRLLQSVKWTTAVVSAVGFGTSIIQRRVFRLLRILLTTINPSKFNVCIPNFFEMRPILKLESNSHEEDFIATCTMDSHNSLNLLAGNDADAMICFLLEVISLLVPEGKHNSRSEAVQLWLNSRQLRVVVGHEALSLMRVLLGIPAWRTVAYDRFTRILMNEDPLLKHAKLTVTCVLGGAFERKRVGGLVALRPFTLLGAVDPSNRGTALSYSKGIVASLSLSSSSAEVILVNQSIKMHNSDGNLDLKNIAVSYSFDVQRNAPVRCVKLPLSDIIPIPEIPILSCTLSNDLVQQILSAAPSILRKAEVSIIADSNEYQDIDIVDVISTLKLLASVVQNSSHVQSVFINHFELFVHLIRISGMDGSNLGLASLEAVDNAFAEVISKITSAKSRPPSTVQNASEEDVVNENMRQTSLFSNDTLSSNSSSNTNRFSLENREASGSSGSQARDLAALLSPFAMALRGVDPAMQSAALNQMLEIGLPREWCEFSLRRCHYNVEMAINMCLEHGDEMPQLIAQEAEIEAGRQRSQQQRASAFGQVQTHSQGLQREVSRGRSDNPGLLRQLIDMGFPPSWCARALESGQHSNLDTALGWILSRDEDTGSPEHQEHSDHSEGVSDTESERAMLTDNPFEEVTIPLELVSGSAVIKKDLTCLTQGGGFPSVGCKGHAVSSGKWYYELSVLTAGCVQVGWATTDYRGDADAGQGVGDDCESWAYDGWRSYLWHCVSAKWGARWKAGDVVGCAVDLDGGNMSFYLNGFGEEIGMGLAVGFIDRAEQVAVFPCVSFNRNESVKFNFGGSPFIRLPEGYTPYIEAIKATKAASISPSWVINWTKHREFRTQVKINVNAPSGDKATLKMMKRYFKQDESKVIGPETTDYFITEAEAKDKEIDHIQLLSLARNLVVLYCRLICLRCLKGLSKLDESMKSKVISGIYKRGNSEAILTNIIQLLQITSLYTNRTKTYNLLHVMQSCTSVDMGNLGSVFCAGGQPALFELQATIHALTLSSLESRHNIFVNEAVKCIRTNLTAIQKHVSDYRWADATSFLPVVVRDRSKDENHWRQTPSISIAHMLSSMVVSCCFKYLSNQKDSQVMGEVLLHVENLLSLWSQMLACSFDAICLISIKMLSYILQDVIVFHKDHNIGRMMVINSDLMLAIRSTCMKLLERERLSQPVLSEYHTALLELAGAVSFIHESFCVTNLEISVDAREFSHLQEQHEEEESSDLCWEVRTGRLLSSEGDWKTWTGDIKFKPFLLPGSTNFARWKERQDLPPELLPGCKVFKLSAESPDSRLSKDLIKEVAEQQDRGDQGTFPLSRFRMLLERSAAAESGDNKPFSIPEDARIGTVVEITSWPGSNIDGNARIVKWDDDESMETVRWGADDMFDVAYCTVTEGKISHRFPNPPTLWQKLSAVGFGKETQTCVILRLRDMENAGKVVGIMEWPQFSATVFCRGDRTADGYISLIEERLLTGSSHSGWEARFGCPGWRRGTHYSLRVQELKGVKSLKGSFEVEVYVANRPFNVQAEITLQDTVLFTFDKELHPPNVVVSLDSSSVSKPSGGGQGCAIGSVGFSTGVHYWEFKIEQGDIGSIFVGVIEKPEDVRSMRLTRWQGWGMVNNRSSYHTAQMAFGERVNVYGDHFQSGDMLGVVLNLNQGTLSFYLDGLKYGEHIMADLGVAHEGLHLSSNKVKPRTFFPIVGLSKPMDRVTITKRWLSAPGFDGIEGFMLYERAFQLLYSWNLERASAPLRQHIWIYREGWRHYNRWVQNDQYRCRVRVNIGSIAISLNKTVRSCVQASLRLGLSHPLLHGDRIVFTKSAGKSLDAKEEAIILGSYRDLLWYKLDSHDTSTEEVMETGADVWFLVASDIEGMSLVKRGGIQQQRRLPAAAFENTLPRLPEFHGGFVRVFHENGAVMRDGIEIDTSEILCTVPVNTTIFAIERRINSSNIYRYLVSFDGHYGWISERMRGGSEETMVRSAKPEEIEISVDEIRSDIANNCKSVYVLNRLYQQEVSSIEEAMMHWEQWLQIPSSAAFTAGVDIQPGTGIALNTASISFKEYLSLSSTTDGGQAWSVEADMQLSELISKLAYQRNKHPMNLSMQDISRGLEMIHNNPSHILSRIDSARILARAAILREANMIFYHTLPMMAMETPEERMLVEVYGSDSVIDVKEAEIPPGPTSNNSTCSSSTLSLLQDICHEVGSSNVGGVSHALDASDMWAGNQSQSNSSARSFAWTPSSLARRWRSLRRLLFTQTKTGFWDSVLDATTTITPLPADEYEDPREIKTIKLNRIQANVGKLSTVQSSSERIKLSVFGQLHKELRSWPNPSFRRAFIGKGHGGQKRAFKVKFVGEGVNDYGGPYRAVFEQIVDELRCDSVAVGGTKSSDRCLLPLLIPSINRVSGAGSNQDKFLLTTSAQNSAQLQEFTSFFGKLIGMSTRHNFNMAVDLSALVWRPLVRLPVSLAHLETVDNFTARNLQNVIELGLQLEKQYSTMHYEQDGAFASSSSSFSGSSSNNSRLLRSSEFVPEDWADLSFIAFLPDGSKVPLIPGGEDMPVNLGNWRDYVRLMERQRLQESSVMFTALRDGMASVLPIELFPLFTAQELEHLLSGNAVVDIELLRRCAEYEDLDPNAPVVQYFWEVLQEMSDEDKTYFLRFVWARSRMPTSAKDFPMNFKLQRLQGLTEDQTDQYLPHAQTCFFSMALPTYSSKEILQEKLLYAIKNSPNMDADVRLHTAEGWGDS